jgi:3-oxoacyl-[acyl-carrier-protein] synthase II
VRAPREPIAVTGLGVVTALGLGRAAFAAGLREGRRGFGPLTRFPAGGFRASLVAEVRDPLPPPPLERRLARRLSRCDRLALAAALEAAADAGPEFASLPRERLAVVLGAGAGGTFEAEGYFAARLRGARGRERGRPRALVSQLPYAATDWVALALGAEGEKATVATACSSSATAIGRACDLLRAGRADAVLAGGAEALCRVTLGGFNALRAIDPRGPRPFDAGRTGMGLGEGAAALVLERLADARRRGARVRALVLGCGMSADAHHMTNPHPEGAGALRAMRAACADAGVDPAAIDHVNAHGTATPANDGAEALAIRRLVGEGREACVAVTSTKGALGHALGAAGAIEAAAVVVSIEEGFVPPTVGLETPDPACGALDLVRGAARARPVRLALSNSFAFGGNNTALVLAHPEAAG